ncbi:MAG: Spx/MgsR family RNA polymerase-binding regulatory protein [Streptococcaceae bacterium]|jgi:regulatory protein spx|nr:Spx/MgsR family RNA polymerase-binding regulatory protein [Streptococcaceae bacterium]
MVKVYGTANSKAVRGAIAWFNEYNIEADFKNIEREGLTETELFMILQASEDGVQDILSTRSKVWQQKADCIEDLNLTQLTQLINENPSILKLPILLDRHKLQTGFRPDDIRIFLPRAFRKLERVMSSSQLSYEM